MKKRAFQKLIPAFFLAVLLSGAAALEVCAFPESFLRDRISPPEENTETETAVSFCCWDDSSDGNLYACWELTGKPAPLRVRIIKNGKAVCGWSPASGVRYNCAKTVAENGCGAYSFMVYVKKNGYETAVTSEELFVDSALYLKLRKKVSASGTVGKTYIGPAGGNGSEEAFPEGTGDGSETAERPVRLSAPQGVKLDEQQILSWDKVENAGRYLIRFYDASGCIMDVKVRIAEKLDISDQIANGCTEVRISALGPAGGTVYRESPVCTFDIQGP